MVCAVARLRKPFRCIDAVLQMMSAGHGGFQRSCTLWRGCTRLRDEGRAGDERGDKYDGEIATTEIQDNSSHENGNSANIPRRGTYDGLRNHAVKKHNTQNRCQIAA